MVKRGAENYLTRDNYDNNEDSDVQEIYQEASKEKLNQRTILPLKKKKGGANNASLPLPVVNFDSIPFKPVAQTVTPNVSFECKYISYTSMHNDALANPSFVKVGSSPSPFESRVKSQSVDSHNQELKAFAKELRGLNVSYKNHIEKILSRDCFADLSLNFTKYQEYKKELISKYPSVVDELLDSTFSSTTTKNTFKNNENTENLFNGNGNNPNKNVDLGVEQGGNIVNQVKPAFTFSMPTTTPSTPSSGMGFGIMNVSPVTSTSLPMALPSTLPTTNTTTKKEYLKADSSFSFGVKSTTQEVNAETPKPNLFTFKPQPVLGEATPVPQVSTPPIKKPFALGSSSTPFTKSKETEAEVDQDFIPLDAKEVESYESKYSAAKTLESVSDAKEVAKPALFAFKPPSTPTSSANSSEFKSAFSFGTPFTPPVAPASTTGLTFGGFGTTNATSNGSTTAPTFTFGQGGFSNSGFTFGQSSTSFATPKAVAQGFTFGTTPATIVSGTEQGKEQGDTEQGEEDAMPPEEQIGDSLLTSNAGEEDEVTLFSIKSKVHVLQEDGSWKLVGLGLLKINQHKKTLKSRIILRGDAGNLFINANLFKQMTVSVKESSVLLGLIVDGKVSKYSAKVKDVEMAKSLKSAMDKGISDLPL